MGMSREQEKTRQDTETESLEAAGIMDRPGSISHHAVMVQADVWGTNLPNGMLRWFGFDFDRVELPDGGILPREDPPRWVADPPGFMFKTGIADAGVVVRAEGLKTSRMMPGSGDEEEEDYAAPTLYRVEVTAHGFECTGEFTCPDWHEVQQRCRQLERRLDESHAERHHGCVDERGEPGEDACSFCERGTPGG